ncbi:hypothetical protein GGS26DRAFT_594687 [Hypomontagnella submonticulosa]|nr:hypothetical protein GGS26DRAFT_594687 [Hypomontagnella submonticulosa]
MLDTAATIGVILVPIVLIAVILAMWYCPFRYSDAQLSPSGAPSGDTPPGAISAVGISNSNNNTGTGTAAAVAVDEEAVPYTAPSYELDTSHRSSRLSRISEEGGAWTHSHIHHHHHHHTGSHK